MNLRLVHRKREGLVESPHCKIQDGKQREPRSMGVRADALKRQLTMKEPANGLQL